MAKKAIQVPKLNSHERNSVYAASRYLSSDLEKKLGTKIKFDVYFQDPLVAAENKKLAFDDDFYVRWEPGLSDGPTSARFVVVDYNVETNTLAKPAKWMASDNKFVDPNKRDISKRIKNSLQFHQVNVWAILQNALDFFENGFGLGRSIPWGFEGNRLIVVPHAGYDQNAFYDRQSKSLQFYYFGDENDRVYTCLSTDIINHEFGHAILDGIRPYYIEAHSVETAAFHEFTGDLTAILIAFRNNNFRKQVADDTKGNLSDHNVLASIARQFGDKITGNPYLRSGLNKLKMSDVSENSGHHFMSQILTGTMFDIIRELTNHYHKKRGKSLYQAFWYTIQDMQRIAIQPYDLLPPADVTYRDYALAVLRAEEIEDPVDPYGLRDILFDAFVGRGILTKKEKREMSKASYVFDRLQLGVFHDVKNAATSKAEAYRFLDDNRKDLFIPSDQDFIVADLYTAQKLGREARRQPKQIIFQYIWREDVELKGDRFGKFEDQTTTMLCGGTLAFDENGNVLSWMKKPGSKMVATRSGKKTEQAKADVIEGTLRRKKLLDTLAKRIKNGAVGIAEHGMTGNRVPPITTREVDGSVRFELAPHLGICTDEVEELGGRQWEISS
jgi:hypothetical protein